jgi:hypothetical protein
VIFNRQSQRAGEGAQQYQIEHVHVGITEQRATEIAEAKAREIVETKLAEAKETARMRLEVFDDILVRRLNEERKLDAFGDPAYQVLLGKAQHAAASTERADDYDC